MKAPTTLVMVAGAVAMAASGTDARAMFARLDYQRYLQEREDTLVELQAWKIKFGESAKKNGWMPVSEDRSADDDDEELLQRFQLAKQDCETASAANPNANFSTDTPFSLMLSEEWTAAGVSGGYRAPNITERRLRGWGGHKSGGFAMGTPQSMSASSNARTTTSTYSSGSGVTTTKTTTSSGSGTKYTSTTSTTKDGEGGTHTSTSWSSTWSSTSAPSTSTSTGSTGTGGYNFSQLISDWMSQWGTVQPAGPSSSSSDSYTFAPAAATTSAPAATTAAPAVTTSAPVATTSAPVATTSAPATTTAAPSTTTEDAATSTTTSSVASDADSSSVDWSSTTCMSPIQYQGSCGDCWAFATIAAVESAQCIANGQTSITKYSEQQLTSCDTQNYGCNGGAPVYAFEYIEETGLCTETDYPFTSDDGNTGSCTSTCAKASTGITGYQQISTADELASVVAKQPVVVAVASSNAAWKQYTGGVLSSCDTTTLDHAVVVVGYTDTEWKIRNSWGETWGEEGYVRLERSSDSDGVCGMYQDMSYPTTS